MVGRQSRIGNPGLYLFFYNTIFTGVYSFLQSTRIFTILRPCYRSRIKFSNFWICDWSLRYASMYKGYHSLTTNNPSNRITNISQRNVRFSRQNLKTLKLELDLLANLEMSYLNNLKFRSNSGIYTWNPVIQSM